MIQKISRSAGGDDDDDARAMARGRRARTTTTTTTMTLVASAVVIATGAMARAASGETMTSTRDVDARRWRDGRGPPIDRARCASSSIDATKRRLESPCGYFDAFEDAMSARLGDGRAYRGDARTTTRGERCAAWSDAENAEEDGLSASAGAEDIDGNACRNGRRGHPLRYAPWCYVNATTGEWGYCDVRGASSSGSDEDGGGDGDASSRPYRFYDRLTRIVRENSLSSQQNPLLEQTDSPTAYSLLYDEKEVYGGKFFDDARVHVEASGELKSFVSRLAAMAVPCDYDDQEALKDGFPTPNATRTSASHVDDAIQRLSPMYPRYLLQFMRTNLPEAVAAGVVTVGDDFSAFSRRALGTRWSRRVCDSLIRCVANGVPELVADVGHNGLYLGSDHKFSSRLNQQLLLAKAESTRIAVARFVAERLPAGASAAYRRAICQIPGETLREKFVFDDTEANDTSAFIELVTAAFGSNFSASACQLLFAERAEQLKTCAKSDFKYAAEDAMIYLSNRRLYALVPFSIFSGFTLLIIIYASRRWDFFNDGAVHTGSVGELHDDADSSEGVRSDSRRSNRLTPWRDKYFSSEGYKIIDVIGRGGSSVVYLASTVNDREPDSDMLVAIKEPHDSSKAKAEIAVLSTMKSSRYMCEFIRPVMDHQKNAWMMMFELCQHGSLRECLKDCTYPRDGSTIHRALTMMCRGVMHVHDSKLAHRDIKLDNFLLSCNCDDYRGSTLRGRCRAHHVIKICDIGFAKSENMMFDSSARITGTLSYVAPERLSLVPTKLTPEVYRKADLYGIGLCAWELLYYAKFGTPKRFIEDVMPDKNERDMLVDAQLVLMISTGRMIPNTDWMSPRVRKWVNKCISFEASNRYRSLEEALTALVALRRELLISLADVPKVGPEDSCDELDWSDGYNSSNASTEKL